MRILLLLLCLLAAALTARPAHAQVTPPATQEGQLRVFLDCSGFYCDQDYLREQIGFVSYMRDRADADVHVLITTQQTGSGGTEYTLAFIGLGRFAGVQQTLRHVSEPGDPEARVREGLAQAVKLGLVRYVAELPQGRRLRVTYEAPATSAAASPERDPWNHWTFRLSGSGFVSGEQTYLSRSVYGSLSAGRVTERWKLRLQVSGSEDRSEYDLDDSTTVVNTLAGRSVQAGAVRSLGGRLSAGVMASASKSSYLNQDLAVRVAPAIEYDLYPYGESTRRQLTVLYAVGPQHFDYQDTTLFGRLSETRVRQNLLATVIFKQPWGSTNVSLEGAAYVDDPRKNRLSLSGGVQLNLLRGLSLQVDGSYERIRDQLYLSAEGATEEDILLQRRQLATGYQYFGYLSLSYTFGSRFTSIVNPRFGGSDAAIVVIH